LTRCLDQSFEGAIDRRLSSSIEDDPDIRVLAPEKPGFALVDGFFEGLVESVECVDDGSVEKGSLADPDPAGPLPTAALDAPPATKARIPEQNRQFLLIQLGSVLSGVTDASGPSGADFFDSSPDGKVPGIIAADDFGPDLGDEISGDVVGEEDVKVGSASLLEFEEPEPGPGSSGVRAASADATEESSEMSLASSPVAWEVSWVGEGNHREIIRLAAP